MPGGSMSNGRVVARPAQGQNSLPVPAARPAYKDGVVAAGAATGTTGPNTKRVAIGSTSKPKPLPKWKPVPQAPARRVRD